MYVMQPDWRLPICLVMPALRSFQRTSSWVSFPLTSLAAYLACEMLLLQLTRGS
jgi:hypothetical protein